MYRVQKMYRVESIPEKFLSLTPAWFDGGKSCRDAEKFARYPLLEAILKTDLFVADFSVPIYLIITQNKLLNSGSNIVFELQFQAY